jgi:hypothetical protein
VSNSKSQAWQSFWEQFGLTVYDESSVPEDASMPRITYSLSTDNIVGSPSTQSVSLWYYSTSWQEISEKADAISAAIGYSGVVLEYDGGYMWIKRGSPFAQRMSDANDSVRRIYLNIETDWLSAN